MQRKLLSVLILLCVAFLAAEVVFIGYLHMNEQNPPQMQESATEPIQTDRPTETPDATEVFLPTDGTEPTEPSEATEPEETEPSTEATEPSTEPTETEPEETEPEEQTYTITLVGDCTLASSPSKYNVSGGFIKTIGEDYGYPFRNVLEYFENDDFTLINLEGVLADSGTGATKEFVFRGPTAYTQILTDNSVEAVTLANNHTMDYGKAGYASTKEALDGAGVPYVEKDNILLVKTGSGLTIGIYAAAFDISTSDMKSDIAKLRKQGAEIVIAALHWGDEGKYSPSKKQVSAGHAAIDAGADIVYGHHPHVLQKIEEYKDGIICYSLGNFSFGGNHFPRDMDSAIIQLQITRDENGKARLGDLAIIPVSISSMKNQNNFQPTPYEEGSKEYNRVLSKLDGTFDGPDLVIDYSFLNPTEPPTGGDTGGDSGDTGSDSGADSGADSGNSGENAPDPGAEEG